MDQYFVFVDEYKSHWESSQTILVSKLELESIPPIAALVIITYAVRPKRIQKMSLRGRDNL